MLTPDSTLLALDASTENCSVALQHCGERSVQHCSVPRSHAQVLLPMIDELLQSRGLRLADVAGLAVSLGPGSFTGIRIALSIAQGLAYGGKIPLYGFNSLEVLAESDPASLFCIPALDARMNEIYWAAYQRCADGDLQEVHSPCVSGVEGLNDFLSSALRPDLPLVGMGHGWGLAGLQCERLAALDSSRLPAADNLLNLLLRRAPRLRAIPPAALEPLYLRNEVAWEKRTRIRQGDLGI